MLDEDRVRALGLPLDPYSPLNQARSDVWRDWPTNYNGMGGKGDIMLVYDAIRQSFNTIAVKVGAMVGADAMYDFVTETLGLRYIDESDADLAPLVLGFAVPGPDPSSSWPTPTRCSRTATIRPRTSTPAWRI